MSLGSEEREALIELYKVIQKDIDEKFEGVSTLISHIRNILKDFQWGGKNA